VKGDKSSSEKPVKKNIKIAKKSVASTKKKTVSERSKG
jgi:hypothetical protein